MDVLPRVMGTFNFVSSWFVYSGAREYTAQNPAGESEYGRPLGFYAASKLCAETLVESYCKTFNKEYRIMRLCNVVGGDSAAGKKKNAVEFLLGKIKRNEDVDVYIGDNYRNYMHVEDVCRAMKIVMECGKQNEIYNIGFAESYRLEDLLKYAIRISGSTSKINRIEAPAFHKIVQAENFHMSCEKLYKLGFRPTYTPFEAISKIISG
jgi:nucleoside-diphosphate-sugar epimerase